MASTVADLKDRYGLNTSETYRLNVEDLPRRRIQYKKAVAIMCINDSAVPTTAVRNAISDFVSFVVEGERPSQLTTSICPAYLLGNNFDWAVQDISQSWLYSVYRYGLMYTPESQRGLNDQVLRIIQKDPEFEAPYDIVVFNATDAVHAVLGASRDPSVTSVEGLAAYLSKRAISFRTLSRMGMYAYPLQLPPALPSLGYRGHGYVFTVEDYNEYYRARETVLALPHARAAVLQGGLMRILASSVRMEDVLEGPSFTPATTQLAIKESGPFGDDLLSQQEIDIICGVYRMFTGK